MPAWPPEPWAPPCCSPRPPRAPRTFDVNTVADNAGTNDCTAVCSLRDAITVANANADADTITFARP